MTPTAWLLSPTLRRGLSAPMLVNYSNRYSHGISTASQPPDSQAIPDVEESAWPRRRVIKYIVSSGIVLSGAAIVVGGWWAISLWLTFRSIERDSLEIDEARVSISSLSSSERPPAPPVEVLPEPVTVPRATEPVATLPGVAGMLPATTTTESPEIVGEQLPYDPAFATSAVIPDDSFNAILIIGTDKRKGLGGSRADVIILALLPEDGSAPILVSLPRDLWLPNACWGRARRINVALNGCGEAASGPELLTIIIADFTGIQADHFALFDFEDFQRVIDAFGGIEICVDNPVRERLLNVPAGCTQVNGQIALTWMRSRHTEEFVDGQWRTMPGVNDLKRNERQRDLLIQLLSKVKSLDALTSLTDIVESISDAVRIDEDMTVTRAIGLAWDLRSVAPRDIIKVTIPVRNHRTEGGAAVLLPKSKFEEIFKDYWP
jgi:LCP family protein required for cell wall assembly